MSIVQQTQGADLRGAVEMPAEWELHRATWLAWPHDGELWGGMLARAQAEFTMLCRALVAGGERVELLVHETSDDAQVRASLAGLDVVIHRGRYGDIWLRDTAPVFAHGRDGLVALSCRFNGWGGKYELAGDKEVAAAVAREAGASLRRLNWVGEGGALEFNGAGICLASACLAEAERNPGMGREALERSIAEAFCVDRVVWLDQILLGDHTDGHVDTLARFVNAETVVCARPAASSDPNREALEQTRRTLEEAGGFDVTVIGSPGPVHDEKGHVMPASYLNFYIANEAVLVPTYGCDADDRAVADIAALFPNRRVEGLSALAILEGGGAFHCITQQEPLSGARA